MHKMSKEGLKELIRDISNEVSGVYTDVPDTGDKNADAVDMLAGNMVQIQRNCENILTETLYRLMEMGNL